MKNVSSKRTAGIATWSMLDKGGHEKGTAFNVFRGRRAAAFGLTALFLLALLGAVEHAAASPQAKPRSQSNVAVVGSMDTFTFATGETFIDTNGIEILLTAPDGTSMSFTRADTSDDGFGNGAPPQVWRLDGVRVGGPPGWVAVGTLDGVPADGTWQWRIMSPGVFYASNDGDGLAGSRPDVTLAVGGKTIRAAFSSLSPAFNNPQFWNWHVTSAAGTFQDDRPGLAADTITQAAEDPNNAIFYTDNQPAAPDPKVKDHADGTCTLYNDQDHDGVVDAGEALQTLPCPKPKARSNPDGSTTIYDDKNGNNLVDPGEAFLTTPSSPDQDGDAVPDGLEPTLCSQENPFFNFDGTCAGSDYHPATVQGLVDDVNKFLP